MSQDPRATAEVRALLACIRVTRDPVEQNRLWNRYYRISDEVFPEAAVLRKRYKGMTGAERQRFKTEYMELVRRLWRATDPEAAYDGPLSLEGAPAASQQPRRLDYTPPASRKPGASRWRWFGVLSALAAVAGAGIVAWQYALHRAVAPELRTEAATEIIPDLEVPSNPPQPPAGAMPPVAPENIPGSGLVDLDPGSLLEVPFAEIDAALAEEIQPVFTPVPSELRGRGDRIRAGETAYEDVYVIESESLYYIRIPGTGAVESLDRAGADWTRSPDTEGREALLALWRQNREAIARAEEARENERGLRIAARRAAQEQVLEARRAAQEEAARRAKEEKWRTLAPAQRHAARIQAYSDWRRIQSDAEKLRELYTNIARTYEYIGVNDSRMADLNKTYQRMARDYGPNYDVEDAFLIYGWGREEILGQLAEWESEYYRMLDYVNEKYPLYEARVQEIERLDAVLPEKIRIAEATGNWEENSDGAPRIGASFGTGFIVAPEHVMTCAHVIRNGKSIQVVSSGGQTHEAQVVTTDAENDWCLLEVKGLSGTPIPIASGTPNVGATIYCLGYPLGGIKDSNDPIVGSGNVAAIRHINGDDRFIQITAPINPGNSGGPVLDQQGRWVGIVSQKLNDLFSLQTSQTVAQGLNYAVKASVVEPLLRSFSKISLARTGGAAANAPVSLEQITRNVSPSIVKIQAD